MDGYRVTEEPPYRSRPFELLWVNGLGGTYLGPVTYPTFHAFILVDDADGSILRTVDGLHCTIHMTFFTSRTLLSIDLHILFILLSVAEIFKSNFPWQSSMIYPFPLGNHGYHSCRRSLRSYYF
jgi:hypothetical protein